MEQPMNDRDVHEACPHCDAAPPSHQLDMHVARVHAELPPCTARIEPEAGGLYTCGFRAGHDGGEYGAWHASKRGKGMGRYIWNDSAHGAVPHRPAEPSDNLDRLKTMGVLSHTVVATGDEQSKPQTVVEAALQQLPPPYSYGGPVSKMGSVEPEPGFRLPPFNMACAALHTDGQGNTIPCPGYPHESTADSDEGRPEPPTEDELNTPSGPIPVSPPTTPSTSTSEASDRTCRPTPSTATRSSGGPSTPRSEPPRSADACPHTALKAATSSISGRHRDRTRTARQEDGRTGARL
jgi:hypothetical protein